MSALVLTVRSLALLSVVCSVFSSLGVRASSSAITWSKRLISP